jgi:hypothetical protein
VLAALNILLFVFHTVTLVFNLTGWIFRRTRTLHLVCLGATLFSWFVMGAWKGIGYCICTDWHFRIRREMGIQDHVYSYLQLMARSFFGVEMDRMTSDLAAGGGLLAILLATLAVWTAGMFRKTKIGDPHGTGPAAS